MRVAKWYILFIVIMVISTHFSPLLGEKLNEEQMTAYRTRPAVVLIYSGMHVTVAFKSGQRQIPHYGSGSGFFVNADGYLVTNGHVVDIYVNYMKDKNGYAQKVLQNYIINLINNQFKTQRGRMPTQQELNSEYMKFMKSENPQVVNHGAINYVLLSNSQALNDYENFEVKKFSPSIPEGGKDIAVLKIERDNCPVLMLGDSSQLTLQQKVFTIGFPAAVDPQRFPLLGKENTLNASITRGSISALKKDYKGMSVIQHDAATSPGNSGGPTVDVKGRVIGVHSYAATQVDGFKFCVPINTAKEFIRETGIEVNKSSQFTDVFNKLMDSVWEERWFDAQDEVSQALVYMKSEPDLERLQQVILSKINEMGFFEKMWEKNPGIVIIAIALIALIILVLIVAFRPSSSEPAVEAQIMDPSPAPAAAPAPPQVPEKTRLDDSDGTRLEDGAFGSISVIVKGEDKGNFDIPANGLTIGRDASVVSIHIQEDIVSKVHVKIVPKGDQFILSDQNSTNGTFVNGEKISEMAVTPNDQIQLGKKGDVKIILKK